MSVKKKRTRKKPQQLSPQALIVDRRAYVAGIKALNNHLKELMEEYDRLYQQFGTNDHPILHSLLAQSALMSKVIACFESSILNGELANKAPSEPH